MAGRHRKRTVAAQHDEGLLRFGVTDRPAGFTTPALSPFDGSAEPVVRELVQNALNAAQEAGRSADVTFTITDVPAALVPGWDSYWHKFDSALNDRRADRGKKVTHDEHSIVERIQSARADTVRMLLCTDNGHGLNPRRMDGLLTTGNSGNTEGGVGSFGLGHLMAFTASNLRYALYGSRYRDADGRLAEIAGGHAILSTHRSDTGLSSADGYLVPSSDRQLRFDGSGGYPDHLPQLLRQHLHTATDSRVTGTVVGVIGFNEFNVDPDDDTEQSAETSIALAAAANFTSAIASNNLTVTVTRHQSAGQPSTITVNRATLTTHLDSVAGQHRAWRQGHVRGVDAHRAHLALVHGEQAATATVSGQQTDASQVTVKYRLRDPNDPAAARGPTRVHLYRRGMWITSDARGLTASEFATKPLFDATVELHHGSFEDVVRAAEGPEHRGLQTKRLSVAQRTNLKQHLAAVATSLNASIDDRPDDNDWEPSGEWAQLTIGDNTPPVLEPVRPRPPTGPIEPDTPPPEPPQPNPPTPNPDPNPTEPKEPGTPRPGVRPDYAATLMATAGTREITADVLLKGKDSTVQALGVRVTTANGSDDTCEQHLPVRYLKLNTATTSTNSSHTASADNTGCEVVLPSASGRQRLTIRLAKPVDDPNSIALDLVRRAHVQESGNAVYSVEIAEAA